MFAHAPRLNVLAKWLEDQSAQTGIISVFAFGGASDLRVFDFFHCSPAPRSGADVVARCTRRTLGT
jgi:hypothetical protein